MQDLWETQRKKERKKERRKERRKGRVGDRCEIREFLTRAHDDSKYCEMPLETRSA